MLIKIVIVVVILILLRNHLGILRVLWPECVGLAIGGMIGWWWASNIIRLDTGYQAFEYIGCPRGFVKPIFAFIGSVVTVGPVSAAIRGLFPPNQENEKK